MKWFSFTREGKLRTMMGISRLSMEITLLSRGYLSNWFWYSSQSIAVCRIFAPIYTPKRYKNESGQHLEHAPFCERDFILPTELETHDEKGFSYQN
jgi:homogentisate 1,2-dioxygenase